MPSMPVLHRGICQQEFSPSLVPFSSLASSFWGIYVTCCIYICATRGNICIRQNGAEPLPLAAIISVLIIFFSWLVMSAQVKYNDIIRRVRLPKNDRLSFDTLETRIRDIFHFPQPATIGMTYVDSDGDLITMADDKDFVEAVVHQGLNPLILHVKGLDEAVPTRSPSISSDQSKVDSQELPKAATDSPKIDTNSASKPAGAKTHKDLADMISEQLAKALGELHGEMSGLESHVNNALNDSKFKEFLDCAPSKLAEVLQAATRSGFDASFEPMFYPSQGPSQKSAQPQTASSSEGVSAAGTNEQKTPGQAGEVKKVAHHGVQCDVCDTLPITGTRFKSLT